MIPSPVMETLCGSVKEDWEEGVPVVCQSFSTAMRRCEASLIGDKVMNAIHKLEEILNAESTQNLLSSKNITEDAITLWDAVGEFQAEMMTKCRLWLVESIPGKVYDWKTFHAAMVEGEQMMLAKRLELQEFAVNAKAKLPASSLGSQLTEELEAVPRRRLIFPPHEETEERFRTETYSTKALIWDDLVSTEPFGCSQTLLELEYADHYLTDIVEKLRNSIQSMMNREKLGEEGTLFGKRLPELLSDGGWDIWCQTIRQGLEHACELLREYSQYVDDYTTLLREFHLRYETHASVMQQLSHTPMVF